MVIVVLILVAVIIYIVSFNKSNHQLKDHISSQGGIEFKYQRLIDFIRSVDPEFKILARSDKSITIGNQLPHGYINFHIVQTFDKLHVRFNLQDKMLGHNKFDWDFNPNLSQDKMFEEIQQGMALFDTRLSNKHFQ